MTNNVLRELNERPIAFYPVYRRLTGSTTAGLLLSQLMYWFSKQDTFYKTNEDIMLETGLTTDELKAAKKKIKSLLFITVVRKDIPAKTYYTIDWKAYEKALEASCEVPPTSSCKSHHTDGGNSTNCMVEFPLSINDKSFDRDYTETTTDIITPKAKSKNKTSFPTDDKELQEYAILKAVEKQINCPVSTYQEFKDHHKANGSKFVDWKSAFNTWTSNFFKFDSDNRAEILRLQGKETVVGTYDYERQMFFEQKSKKYLPVTKARLLELIADNKVLTMGRV